MSMTGQSGVASFRGTPVKVLRRTYIIRIVSGLFLLPACLLTAAATVGGALAKPFEALPVIVTGSIALVTGALLCWLFWRESGLEVRLYADGIELSSRSGSKGLRWTEVTEVWIRAVKVQAGGLIGAGIAAAIEAAKKNKTTGLDESTNLTVRIVGSQGEIKLSSNYKGAVAALEATLGAVNPRLVEEKLRQAQGGGATFGKVTLSSAGVAVGRKTVPLGEIESLLVQNGRLNVKKKGAWLVTTSVQAAKVPNLYVLTEVFGRLTGGLSKTETGLGKGVSSKMWA